MSAPGKQQASSSAWGTFFSSAFEGVESRIDRAIDGENEQQKTPAGTQEQQPTQHEGMAAAPPKPKPKPAGRPSANDRLQARLAKAIANRSTAGSPSPRSSMDQPSPTSTARASLDQRDEARRSTEVAASTTTTTTPSADPTTNSADEPAKTDAASTDPKDEAQGQAANTQAPGDEDSASKKDEPGATQNAPRETPKVTLTEAPGDTPASQTNAAVPEPSKGAESTPDVPKDDKADLAPNPTEPDATPSDNPTSTEPKSPPTDITPEPASITSGSATVEVDPKSIEPKDAPTDSLADGAIDQNIQDLKASHLEEMQEYVERIDSLQSKLQYLSKNAAESAKKTAKSAPSGSTERQLAEKDEKIALLLEEGRKLSNSEQKFRATIRKLRTQVADNEKQLEGVKKEKEKVSSEADTLRNRLNSSEETEKHAEQVRKAGTALQKEIDALKRESAAKDEAFRRLEQDMREKAEQQEAASAEAHSKALAVERQKQQELEDAIAGLRSDKEALSEKSRLGALDWQEKSDRAAERARIVEDELRLELRAAESKLEAMRAAAEEATSGAAGESQVKLIRQIETLQSQYASASDNWQGIEASLLTKVSNLEKERDDAQRRESEMRKKARDSSSRSKRLEDELQDATVALTTAQRELESCREQLETLRTSAKAAEAALEETRADLEKQQRAANRDFSVDSDRRPWASDEASGKGQSQPESPRVPASRTYSTEMMGLPVPGRLPRRSPTPGSQPDSGVEGTFFGRRLSSQPPMRPGALSTAGSALPPPPISPFEPTSESPRAVSPPVPEQDDGIDDNEPPSMAQDMISVSTIGAGPSVQLVERMSAAIRRLEAEKVAAKEEMTRVCGQRDEARSDMVGLMKDLEEAKAATTRVTELETQMTDINARYQTTLEMLGEKSELVEELKADVQDVKEMYRELVERTVK